MKQTINNTKIIPQYTSHNQELVKLVLSTDILGIYKPDNTIDFLIKGKDNNAYILECPVETAMKLIDYCYDTIHTNEYAKIVTSCNTTIIFKATN